MKKHLQVDMIRRSLSGKTNIWSVTSMHGDELGQIRWMAAWRCYAFYPATLTAFEESCLRKIAKFCEEETDKLRQQWKKRKAENT